MKKLTAVLLVLILCLCSAYAESAAEYAAWLEEALPDAAYQDADIPDFAIEYLSQDYDIAVRTDKHYSDIRCESYGSFETGKFRITDEKGNIYYDFVLQNGVSINAYDNARHIIITVDENPGAYNPYTSNGNMICYAAEPELRSRLAYAAKKGFSLEGGNISVYVHNKESWQLGATDQPSAVYMNIDETQNLFGERYLEREVYQSYARIPLGIYYQNGETFWEFVISEGGVYGLESGYEGKLYAAGPGFQAVLDEIEAKLGYKPGDITFTEKTPVRASFEWQAGEMTMENNGGYEIRRWNAGAVSIDDSAKLNKLANLIRTADFTIGSVNCPSPAFMTIEYSDGSCASFAVAVNSFKLFFRNGILFTTEGDIIDLFNLRETEFYEGFVGL